jgi:hypothetical protein
MQAVLTPLGCDPPYQLGVSAVYLRNIAVPVDFSIVGKFTQTVLPGAGAAVDAPFLLALWLPLVSRPLTQSFVTSRPGIVGSNFLVTRLVTSACCFSLASSCFSSTNQELCH